MLKQSIREQCVFDTIADVKKSHWFRYMDLLTYDCVQGGSNDTSSIPGVHPISEDCNLKTIKEIIRGKNGKEIPFSMTVNMAVYNDCVAR